jgi:hypothetical protein
VHWSGSYVGLYFTLTGASAQLTGYRDEQLRPLLIQALEDDRRFVAAHVLLTSISKVQFANTNIAGSWNGLNVTLFGDGRTEIPKGEREKIVEKWRNSSSKER